MSKEFIDQVGPIVQKLAPNYDIKCCSAVISQAIIESGWGDSKLSSQYHNYFGIKCGTNWNGPSVNMTTNEEYQPGVITEIKDNFRVYANMEEGIKGYFELIQLPRYANLKGVTDYREYARLIKEDGYATSSSYTDLIIQVIEENNLTRFDPTGNENEVKPVMASVQKLVERMIYWCTQANLGYDQSNRWDIRVGGECDCSSLVIFACREAGFDTGSASYTGNMSANFTARGWKRVSNNGNPQYGDILLNDTHHVAVYIGNGQLAQASIDENGRVTGGAAGDQIDYETNVKGYYNYPWDCYLRYAGAQSGSSSPSVDGSIDDLARRVINGEFGDGDQRRQLLGDKFDAVQKRVNEILNGGGGTDVNSSSIDELAQKVINGDFGYGDARKQALGDKYDEVQKRVNEILSGNVSSSDSIDDLAKRVINGELGNGDARRAALGDKYDEVQKRVNEILTGTAGAPEGASTNSSVPAGTYQIVVPSLNIRASYSTGAAVVGAYSQGQTVVLDGWSTVSDGCVWGRYQAYSGSTRYIAVRTTSGSEYARLI